MDPEKQVPTLDETISQFRTNVETKRWQFYTLDDEAPLTRDLNIKPCLQRLRDMKQEWRRERVAVPNLWAPTNPSIVMHGLLTPVYNMSLFTAPIRSAIDRLSWEEMEERYSTFSIKPDFGIAKRRIEEPVVFPLEIKMSYDRLNMYSTCFTHSASLMLYDGGEQAARYAISGMFCGIPGCWMARSPQVHVPSSLLLSSPPSRDMDFAVFVNSFGSSSPVNRQRDMGLGISVMRPALLIAMKGPNSWGSSVSLRPQDDPSSTIGDLALHAQVNLDILQMTWRIRHDGADSVPPLPDYGIIFGVVYDSQCVQIVAHVALPLEENSEASEYISILVDTLEFPSSRDPANKDFRTWSMNRIRLILALLTVQRHLLRLSALWDNIQFPSDIVNASRRLDEAVLGPAPSVRMCGSTWTQLGPGAKEHWLADEDCIINDPEDVLPILSPEAVNRIEVWRVNVSFDDCIELVDEDIEDAIKEPVPEKNPELMMLLLRKWLLDFAGWETM